MIRAFSETNSNEALDFVATLKAIDAEIVYDAIKRNIMRSYLFLYFIMLLGNWWIGSIKIVNGKWSSRVDLSKFSIPEFMVWPLIIALLFVVINYKINIGFLSYIGWNILLIIVTLYGLRGIGIIKGIFLALNVPRSIRVLAFITAVMVLMQPGLKYIVLIAVPALGVSEIWINYKNIGEKKNDNESNS
jgi:hypothetical protein